MAHRDLREPLRERREQLLDRLAAIELREDEGVEEERRGLLIELDEVRRSLEQLAPRGLPVLSSLRLVRGCDVAWETMVGSARVRHCGICDREVYDLTAMDADEVEAFLAARRDALPCLRLHRRFDGRVQAGPCARPRKLGRAIAVATALGLAALAGFLVPIHEEDSCRREPAARHGAPSGGAVMGEYRSVPSTAAPAREPFGWNNVPRPLPEAPTS